MKTVLVLSVLVAGCGVPGEFNTLCDTKDVAAMGGQATRLDCTRLAHNLALTKKYMMQEFTLRDGSKFTAIHDEAEWQHYFAGMSVWVSEEVSFQDPNNGEELWGYYDGVAGQVSLNSQERAMTHEFFHRIDTMRLNVSTINHDGWDTNGYYQVIDFYEVSYQHPLGEK